MKIQNEKPGKNGKLFVKINRLRYMATTTNSSNPSSSSSSSAQEVKTAELFDDHRYSADDNNMSPMLSPQFDVGLLDGQNTLSLVDSTQWRDLLATGSRVDAQDGDSMWYESIIEESSSDSVTVRFLGWSRKWNALLPRDSRRIALRNTKVPNWRQTLTPGKCVEVSTSDSCTWCTAVVSVVAPTKFQVMSGGEWVEARELKGGQALVVVPASSTPSLPPLAPSYARPFLHYHATHVLNMREVVKANSVAIDLNHAQDFGFA